MSFSKRLDTSLKTFRESLVNAKDFTVKTFNSEHTQFALGFVLIGIASAGLSFTIPQIIGSFLSAQSLNQFGFLLDVIAWTSFPIMAYLWGALYYNPESSKDAPIAKETKKSKSNLVERLAHALGVTNAYAVNSMGIMFNGLGLLKTFRSISVKYLGAIAFAITGIVAAMKLTYVSIMKFYTGKTKVNGVEMPKYMAFLKQLSKLPKDRSEVKSFAKNISAVIFGLSIACLNFIANLVSWEIILNPLKLLQSEAVQKSIIDAGNYNFGHLAFGTVGAVVTFLSVVPLIYDLLNSSNEAGEESKARKPSVFQKVSRVTATFVNTLALTYFVKSTISQPLFGISSAFALQYTLCTLSFLSILYYSYYSLFNMNVDNFERPALKFFELAKSDYELLKENVSKLQEQVMAKVKMTLEGIAQLVMITAFSMASINPYLSISTVLLMIYDRYEASIPNKSIGDSIDKRTFIEKLSDRALGFLRPSTVNNGKKVFDSLSIPKPAGKLLGYVKPVYAKLSIHASKAVDTVFKSTPPVV